MRQVFKLQDYEISVDYGSHVIYRMKTRFYDLNPAELDFVFENIFTDEKVADFLINDVRIGEDVVVIDEDSGISFAVNIGTDCFYVKTLFNGFDGKLLIGDMQQNSSVDKPLDNTTVPAEVTAEGTIYVCYEENSAALYADAGNINHMFVTTDVNQMRKWVAKSLQYAENGKYYPINEWEKEQFISEIGVERTTSVWVYLGCREDARENYGICVDRFDLSKSSDLLSSIF